MIRSVPPGRVATYGQIARAAGLPTGARQVARILHTCTESHQLPWYRIVGSGGRISLSSGAGLEEQAAALIGEGVTVDRHGRIDLSLFSWDEGNSPGKLF